MADEVGGSHRTVSASLTFVGTATTVLRLGPFTVLTDPNFVRRGQRVHLGYGLSSRRRTDPACTIAELPRLDAVLLSHLHGDHFDRVARRDLPRDPPVLTTREAARRLRRWGFDAAGLDTWQEQELTNGEHRLRVTAVPARHGPIGFHRLLPPVMGTVLDLHSAGARTARIYVTGDTLNVPELAAIRERFDDIDAMIVHLGGTRVLGVLVTLDDQQGCDLVERISPASVVPIHHDDYGVFRSPLSAFVTQMRRRGLAGRLRIATPGETVPLT
jgi:L-ascorbate metabolism protein UlaG (beta-lactamase superfamily)